MSKWFGRMLVAGLVFAAVVARAQELRGGERRGPEPAAREQDTRTRAPNPAARELGMRLRELDVEEREMELGFRREMQGLKLQEQRLALETRKRGPGQRGAHGGMRGPLRVMALICMVSHILLAVWVYQDIRKRGAGSGLWIVVTLLSGFFGALVYAVVRLGDRPAEDGV